VVNKPDRYCLITGCAGGIGQALVKGFTSAGYHVIATDIDVKPDGLDCLHYIQADLFLIANDEQYAIDFFSTVRQYVRDNGLHVLINNAAIQILGGVDSLTRQDWQNTLDVNLLAPFFLTKSFLPELESAKGSVINISSIHATLTKSNFVAYATSKAALSGMTKAMAIDLGSRIRVNAIEPAAIETEMLIKGLNNNPELLRNLKDYHPVGQIGQSEELAKLAIMIANEGMDFLHGACITLDGGISSRLFDPE
jgi:NAD(P)-dependent dehydrogenase (short-subunit alcohol dehydrogenase family)